MDFTFNEEQSLIQDQVDQFVQKEYDWETRQSLSNSELGFGEDNWKKFAELGWLGISVSEDSGGFGGSAISFQNTTNMKPISDSEGFILVYPQGAYLNGFSHWNAGLDTPENKSDVDDFGFIEALINKLSADYNIDENRVYACGFSNGAFFSYSLACYHSDRIAAIGSVSGSMIDETKINCDPIHPTAMINLHGTYDFIVPYDGGEGIEPIDQVIKYWTQFNNTDTIPLVTSVEDAGKTIERYLYENGDNSTSVVHYKIIGGDHSWFDISYEGANTSQLIWDFVSKYDKNGVR